MTDDLDRLIGAAPPDDAVRLAGVEEAVWARVGQLRERAGMSRIRVAAVTIALVVGVANGGLMLLSPEPEPSELRIFTVSAGLSPLASLDVRG